MFGQKVRLRFVISYLLYSIGLAVEEFALHINYLMSLLLRTENMCERHLLTHTVSGH